MLLSTGKLARLSNADAGEFLTQKHELSSAQQQAWYPHDYPTTAAAAAAAEQDAAAPAAVDDLPLAVEHEEVAGADAGPGAAEPADNAAHQAHAHGHAHAQGASAVGSNSEGMATILHHCSCPVKPSS